jgi:hypothetical protein
MPPNLDFPNVSSFLGFCRYDTTGASVDQLYSSWIKTQDPESCPDEHTVHYEKVKSSVSDSKIGELLMYDFVDYFRVDDSCVCFCAPSMCYLCNEINVKYNLSVNKFDTCATCVGKSMLWTGMNQSENEISLFCC